MNTGDIILYTASRTPSRWWLFDAFIDIFTWSEWVHVGIVVKDPSWIDTKGTYLWESSITKEKFGVQMAPLDDRIVPGSTYYRKFKGEPIDMDKLKKIYDDVHDKPYDADPLDWVKAFLGLKSHPQRENSFWCSALVACILTKAGVLDKDTDWSEVAPKFFGDGYHPAYGPIKNLVEI